MGSFPYSDTNKRYHTLDYYLRHRFGCKVVKVSLNGGFTCPNIDGTKGTGGCAFCTEGSGHFAGDPLEPIATQLRKGRDLLTDKWGECPCIAYFQANTNTYCTVDKLRRLTDEALACPDVVGIAISTRPDCIPDDMLAFLTELSQRTFLTVELGLQTIHDGIALRLGRCHTYGDFTDAVDRLHAKGIDICAHIIDGLPGETFDMMMQTAEAVARLPLHSVKIHLLHILRGTRLAADYERGIYIPLTMDEYVDIVCSQLQVLPPSFVIERITGDGAKADLIAPLWSLRKRSVLNAIDKRLAALDTMQGAGYICP